MNRARQHTRNNPSKSSKQSIHPSKRHSSRSGTYTTLSSITPYASSSPYRHTPPYQLTSASTTITRSTPTRQHTSYNRTRSHSTQHQKTFTSSSLEQGEQSFSSFIVNKRQYTLPKNEKILAVSLSGTNPVCYLFHFSINSWLPSSRHPRASPQYCHHPYIIITHRLSFYYHLFPFNLHPSTLFPLILHPSKSRYSLGIPWQGHGIRCNAMVKINIITPWSYGYWHN